MANQVGHLNFEYFNKFVPEIRMLIWEHALPPRRVFHVMDLIEDRENSPPSSSPELEVRRFVYWQSHSPPVVAHVCKESRHMAQQHCFLLCNRVWFNAEIDMLYLDHRLNELLPAQKLVHIIGAHRVRHIGYPSCDFFTALPRPLVAHDYIFFSKVPIGVAKEYFPQLRTLNFLATKLPNSQPYNLGREPLVVRRRCEATIEPLPEDTPLPLLASTNEVRDDGSPVIVYYTATLSEMRRVWRDCLDSMGRSIGRYGEPCQGLEFYDIRVFGWWLVRSNVPAVYRTPRDNHGLIDTLLAVRECSNGRFRSVLAASGNRQ
ncbi:hypothetical protein EDB81DRAFT_343325 [Dactylonectria macrodidyma]|uniref:2EXR domain-containing protein n=1 Tax=Dactylonectria macrodidyma TaxID=307937 RepID=A0A9P9FI34_9HYPO|nr:hypothetical protein EDB81DRAFT_343325 [Dactylonectria macrodidyma]